MTALASVILFIVRHRPGVADVELAVAIFGELAGARITRECESLAAEAQLERRPRADGLIGNFPGPRFPA